MSDRSAEMQETAAKTAARARGWVEGMSADVNLGRGSTDFHVNALDDTSSLLESTGDDQTGAPPASLGGPALARFPIRRGHELTAAARDKKGDPS